MRIRKSKSRSNAESIASPSIFASKIETTAVDRLTPFKNNPRTHSKEQVNRIARSIEHFGFTVPILVDEKNHILAGHGRWQAAQVLGLRCVPTIKLNHLSAQEKKAYVIADNKLAQMAGWDRELLAMELQELVDVQFDIELTGFSNTEVDFLLDEAAEAHADPGPEDQVPEIPLGQAISRPGDLWRLGQHRLLCGDAREQVSYSIVLGEERADVAFADAPYNLRISGHVSGNGKIKHREFAMASGELSPDEFIDFLRRALGLAASFSSNGSVHFVCIDWRHIAELQAAGRDVYGALLNLCVWAKTNGGMGSLYRSQHELVLVFRVGSGPHLNNVELGRHGRNRSNVWSYAGVNTFRDGRLDELAAHPTTKPVALIADAIRDVTRRGAVVLDPFVGSGSTLIAAEKTGRLGRGIEIDALYVDVAIRRWQTYTGKQAIHAENGLTFEDIEIDLQRSTRRRGGRR